MLVEEYHVKLSR